MGAQPDLNIEISPLDPFIDPQPADYQPLVLARDSFTRANSTTTMGSEEERLAPWTVSAGSTWGINGNQAYKVLPASAAWHEAWVDAGSAQHVASVTLASITGATAVGLVARLVDASNYYHLSCDIGAIAGLALWKKVAGAYTLLAGTRLAQHQVKAGDRVSLGCVGSNVFVMINGVIAISLTDTSYVTGTKCGITQFDASTAPRFDNFEVLSGAWHRLDTAGASVRDSFTRPDSALTMGSSETPNVKAWTPDSGVFGISAGKAYRVTAGADRRPTTVDLGSRDQEVSATLTGANEVTALALRHTNINDYLLVYAILNSGTNMGVYTSVNQTYPLIGALNAMMVSGDRLTCRIIDNLLTIEVNGRYRDQIVIPSWATGLSGTRAGWVPEGGIARMDDFVGHGLTATANRPRGITTGRSRPTNISKPAEPGMLNLKLDNRNRWLDPTNSTSPYAGLVGFNTQIRTRLKAPAEQLQNILTEDDALAEVTSGSWVTWLNSTYARDLEMSRHGRACHRITATASGNASAGTALGAGAVYSVRAGFVVTFGVAVAPAVTARTVSAEVRFYTAAGAQVGAAVFGTAVNEVVGQYVPTPASQATVPATATTMAIGAYVAGCAAGEVHYVDEVWVADPVNSDYLAQSAFQWPGGFPLARGYIDHIIPEWDLEDAAVTITATDASKPLNGKLLPTSVADVERFKPSTSVQPIHAWPLGEERPEDAAPVLVDIMSPASNALYAGVINNPQKGEALTPYAERTPLQLRATGQHYLYIPIAALPAPPWTIEIGIRAVDKDTSDIVKISTTNRAFDISIIPGLGSANGRTIGGSTFGFLLKTGYMRPHYISLNYDGVTLYGYADGAYQGGAAGVMRTPTGFILIGIKAGLGGGDVDAYADTDVGDLVIYNYIRTGANVTEVWNAYVTPWSTDATVGARVATMLGSQWWPSTLNTTAATDDAVAPARLRGDSMLEYLRRLEATEDGSRLWVSSSGIVSMRRRGMAPLASEVFGGTGRPVRDMSLDMAGDAVYGKVEITRASPPGSPPSTAVGGTGGATLSLKDTEHTSAMTAYASAQRRLVAQGTSRPVLRNIKVTPQRSDVGWMAALGRDMTRRVIAKASPPGGGSTLSQLGEIIGVSHAWAEGDDVFETTYTLLYVAEAP